MPLGTPGLPQHHRQSSAVRLCVAHGRSCRLQAEHRAGRALWPGLAQRCPDLVNAVVLRGVSVQTLPRGACPLWNASWGHHSRRSVHRLAETGNAARDGAPLVDLLLVFPPDLDVDFPVAALQVRPKLLLLGPMPDSLIGQ